MCSPFASDPTSLTTTNSRFQSRDRRFVGRCWGLFGRLMLGLGPLHVIGSAPTAGVLIVGFALLGTLTAAAVDGASSPSAGSSGATIIHPILSGDVTIYASRIVYRRAAFAVRTGRQTEFQRELPKLDDYPLRPYLVFFDARRRLSRIGPDQARTLRDEFAGTPIADRFFRQWLDAQAQHGRWKTYADHFEPTDDTVGRCHYLRALIRTGKREEALAQVRELWMVPRSQPEACDPVFHSWISAGHLDQETVWERLTLSLEANETRLARYLLRFFDRANEAAGRLCYDVHLRPEIVRSLSRFPDTRVGRRPLRHGLIRYARKDAEQAHALWARIEKEYDFKDAERRSIGERLAVAAADEGRIPAHGPVGYAAEDAERVAEAMVRNQRWAEAALWISALPAEIAAQPRWRYWLGRALIDSGEAPDAGRKSLAQITGSSNWYGLLAAADLDLSTAIPDVSSHNDQQAWRALLEIPAVGRMVELLAVDDPTNARREWQFALPSMTQEERKHLVELTASLGWVDQAIAGAWDAKLIDLTPIRFPTPHLGAFRRGAVNANLPISLLLAISRRESAFNPRARSPAGARGLMQLMPTTANLVADRLREKRPSIDDLLHPDTNVRLGAHHLAALMGKYGGNRALAVAAYNAGESRVQQWLKDASGMPTAVWIERIPFRETRDYVKNVLLANTIYAHKTGQPGPVLETHERLIP